MLIIDNLNYEAYLSDVMNILVPMIVCRKEIDEASTEGSRDLAKQLSKGTGEYAFPVKGLDLICVDPRGIKAFGLIYAIASRGGDHLRTEPIFELTERYEEAEKSFGIRDIADRLSDNGKAILVEYTERQALLSDCMAMFKNIRLSMDIIDFEFASGLLIAGTGLRFTPNTIVKELRGIIEIDRRMNIDFGIDAGEDSLPKRYTEEPLKEGPSKRAVVAIEKMVKDDCLLRGWDEKGNP